MHLSLLDHRVVLDTSALAAEDSAILERLWEAGSWRGAAEAPVERTIRILPRGSQVDPGPDDLVVATDEDISYAVSQHVTRIAIGLGAGDLLMFHAAGLRTPSTGAVVGVIAASGTGKTTFCTSLGRQFGYATDETLAVDPATAEVLPYPKPLSVIENGSRVPSTGKVDHAPASLGMTPVTARTPLGALVLAERAGTEERLEPISLAEGIELAIPQSSSFFALEHPLARLADALTLAGGPWRLRFASQKRCAELLDTLPTFDGPSPEWTHVPGPVARTKETPETSLVGADPGPLGERDRIIRAPWDDAVISEGRAVVLFGRQPVILGGVGAVVWEACTEPLTLIEIMRRVVAVLGGHPRARRLVEEGVSALVSQGVLRLA